MTFQKSEARKRWEASVKRCDICQGYRRTGRECCLDHLADLDAVTRAESRALLARDRVPPLPKPAPLPPRRPT